MNYYGRYDWYNPTVPQVGHDQYQQPQQQQPQQQQQLGGGMPMGAMSEMFSGGGGGAGALSGDAGAGALSGGGGAGAGGGAGMGLAANPWAWLAAAVAAKANYNVNQGNAEWGEYITDPFKVMRKTAKGDEEKIDDKVGFGMGSLLTMPVKLAGGDWSEAFKDIEDMPKDFWSSFEDLF